MRTLIQYLQSHKSSQNGSKHIPLYPIQIMRILSLVDLTIRDTIFPNYMNNGTTIVSRNKPWH